jgi:hypothetical protein
MTWLDEGARAYEKRYELMRITALKAKANELGYPLLPNS